MATSSTDTNNLLKKFVCPNCHHHITPPIRQCVMGHSICDDCFPGLSNCPVCQRAKSDTRCFAMEDILSSLRIQCRYQDAGCKEVLEGTYIRIHEKYCKYALRACPFKFYHQPIVCEWNGNLTELEKHCTLHHKSNFHIGSQILLCDVFGSNYFSVIYAYGRYFRGTVNTKNYLTKWAVYLINETEDDDDDSFIYEIKFSNTENINGGELSLRAPCVRLPKEDYNVDFTDDHLMLPRRMVKKYCDKENKITYIIKITRKD